MPQVIESSGHSSIDLAENDVLRADNRNPTGNHVPTHHFIKRCEMSETRRANFQPVRFIGTIGNQINTELPFRRFDRSISLARRYMHTFGEQLEKMDQLLH